MVPTSLFKLSMQVSPSQVPSIFFIYVDMASPMSVGIVSIIEPRKICDEVIICTQPTRSLFNCLRTRVRKTLIAKSGQRHINTVVSLLCFHLRVDR